QPPAMFCLRTRFIPACAGNTCVTAAFYSAYAVHPRMRREHASYAAPAASPSGSSPHARGTLTKQDLLLFHIRFIPACAGNTAEVQNPVQRMAVHPRMRGEHARIFLK